jgi:two-component system sensor histidine kinase KdpD
MEQERQSNAQQFLDLIQKSRKGKFKIYIGMSAGVGKTYRMLQEAHILLKKGIDVKIGYVETHARKETHELLSGLSVIPRRTIFYKGKELEELDVQAIINLRPEVVIVDELAHSNIQGSKNEKRWQDVLEVLEAGINVISAINIQHIESLNMVIKAISGIEVQERVPDNIIGMADEVVNIDLTVEELINRLKDGKIYAEDKIQLALANFFKSDQLLKLRELALKEVASQVLRKVEYEKPKNTNFRQDKLLACISSNDKTAKIIIRKTARLASYYNSKWLVLYVQTPQESSVKIPLAKQRYLINNLKLATQLGAEVIRKENNKITNAILEVVEQKQITTVCIGKPHFNLFKVILSSSIFNKLLNKLASSSVDLIILS